MLKKKFYSFDRGISIVSNILKPDKLRLLKGEENHKNRISRGSGLSYAAASFGENICSVSHSFFNRIVDFDASKKEIEVESGVTLNELYNFLIDYNLYLKIQPGYSLITIGGCVACDVHGKNQSSDGNFKNQVVGINLFHPLHGDLYLSRSENSDIFDLTCGGLGLTGHILSVRLTLHDIPSHFYSVKCNYFDSFNSSVDYLESNKNAYNAIYGWHDFSIHNKKFSDGIIFTAEFTKKNTYYKNLKKPKKNSNRNSLHFPVFNNFSSYVFNLLYKNKHRFMHNSFQDIYSFLFPIESYIQYYSLFGKKGFCEYQFIIPQQNTLLVIDQLKNFILKNRINITLSSSKYFAGKQTYLSFCGTGLCLALNFRRDYKSILFIKFLDYLTVKYNCLPNIIKDSRMSRNLLDSTYPEANIFRKKLKDFDPKRIFISETSVRLGL